MNGGILSRGRPIKVHQSQRGLASVVGAWQERTVSGKPIMRPLEKCGNDREGSKAGERGCIG